MHPILKPLKTGIMNNQNDIFPIMWSSFFPKVNRIWKCSVFFWNNLLCVCYTTQQELYNKNDRRVSVVNTFVTCLGCNFINVSRDVIDAMINKHAVLVNINYLCSVAPFNDLLDMIFNQPNDIIGCIGVAISMLLSQRLAVFNNNKLIPIVIHPRLICVSMSARKDQMLAAASHVDYSFSIPLTPFRNLKSTVVGQLVCIVGYIMKATKAKPLVQYASFRCGKCNQRTLVYLEDGQFTYAQSCATQR